MEGAVAFTSVSVIAAHGVCFIAGLVMVVNAMTVVIAMNEQTDAIVIVMMMILNHGA